MKRTVLYILLFLCFSAHAQHNVKFVAADIKNDSVFNWTVWDDQVNVNYILQQNRWNSWKDLDTVHSSLLKDEKSYSVVLKKYVIKGENKFRIKAVGEGMLVFSKILMVTGKVEASDKDLKLNFSKKKNKTLLDFGRDELYEIYDKDGKMIRTGFARTVELKDLPEGKYFLNYGNTSTEFSMHS